LSPELIGVIVGGSIGLLATALGHAFAWLQLKSNRAFDLRQAIYIESAAAMATALEFFSKVSQLDVEDSQLAGFIQFASVAMYKIHVVGTPSTIAALSNANQSLTMAALELMKRRAVLRAAVIAASQVETMEARQQAAGLQKELFLESMRASLRYQRELIEVNISARRELGLPLDETQYRKVSQEAERKIVTAIDRTILELEQQLQPNQALEPTAR
jgi:hypothetical protein